MAYAADVLASTLQDLLPKYTETFTFFHPLWSRIKAGGGWARRQLKGPYMEFNILTGGPGQMITEENGGAVLAGGLRENLVRGNEFGARMLYYFNVPQKSLDEADTAYDFADLVKNYGEPAMAEAAEIISNQMARGASSAGSDPLVVAGTGARGILTFNSDQTYNPQGTARTGVFEYTATQVDTVHGIPKRNAAASPTAGWYHQYGNITSFPTDGRRVMRTVIDTANQQGATMSGGVNLLIGDHGSYQNYLADLDDQVQVAVVEGDKTPGKVREGVAFRKGVEFFPDPSIDISDTTAFTTAAARNGVIYLFCTDDWELFTVGGDNASKNLMKVQDPIKLPDRDMVHYRVQMYFNMFCQNLRRQGVITGGAQA